MPLGADDGSAFMICKTLLTVRLASSTCAGITPASTDGGDDLYGCETRTGVSSMENKSNVIGRTDRHTQQHKTRRHGDEPRLTSRVRSESVSAQRYDNSCLFVVETCNVTCDKKARFSIMYRQANRQIEFSPATTNYWPYNSCDGDYNHMFPIFGAFFSRNFLCPRQTFLYCTSYESYFNVFKCIFFKPIFSTHSVIHELIVVFNLLLKMANDFEHKRKDNKTVLLTQFNELRWDVEMLALKTLYDVQIPVCGFLRQLSLKDCFKLIVSVIFQ